MPLRLYYIEELIDGSLYNFHFYLSSEIWLSEHHVLQMGECEFRINGGTSSLLARSGMGISDFAMIVYVYLLFL